MKNIRRSKILKNEQLSDYYWLMKLQCEDIAREAKPGQFIEVYFENSTKIFPRPFSIANSDGKSINIIYKVIGSQTEIMASWIEDQEVQILGPLGNNFQVSIDTKTFILVGGGVGLAPMVFMSNVLEEKKIDYKLFVGGRDNNEYFPSLQDEKKLYLSTDNGSLGFHGNVVQNLEKEIGNIDQPAVILACGPEKMCEALKNFGKKYNVEVLISMETIMACGMGLCQGCSIKTIDEQGKEKFSLVCKEGLVFKGSELKFD